MLRLHDTASGRVAELVPRDPGAITLYVCGPTVYGAPHVGHGRMALVYDVLRRYLQYVGNSVHHVSNVTDIDDKIIDRANREQRSWQDVAADCEAEWWETMDAMGLLRPDDIPHATDYVEQMNDLISELVADDKAYETSDGVYLAVNEVPDYGLLKHQSLESLLAGARVDVVEEKRSPGDFALWKKAKPNEPNWPSPFGAGRPGWHTECVVMSLSLLGEGFDLHGGGQDLIFPHHENERAQAVAVGKRFAGHWMHNGLVTASGEKMSKSLGNFITLQDLLATTDARAYRLLVLQSHYRSPLEVTEELLQDAKTTLVRLDALACCVRDVPSRSSTPDAVELEQQFVAAMEDDLGAHRAVALLFDSLRRANASFDAGDGEGGASLGQAVLRLFAALGVATDDAEAPIDPAARQLGVERDVARSARDFARADALRDELIGLGYRVEDTPAGTRLYR